MSEQRVASRYAKALFDKAVEDNALEAVKNDMLHLMELSQESRDFVLFLESPLYKMATKKAAIEKLTASYHPLSKGLFSLMIDKFREAYIPAVGNLFIQMYNRKFQIMDVFVTSAVELSKDTLNSIEKYVVEQTQAKSVVLNTQINSRVIGGLTIEFDGKIYDSTVVNQLNKIKKELQIA